MKRAWAWALVAIACGPTTPGDGSGGGSADGSDTTTGVSSITATSSTTGASATGEGDATGLTTTFGDTTASTDPTADTTTDADTDTATDTSEGLCPPPERVIAYFALTPDQDVAAICTVMAEGGVPGSSEIQLDCEGQIFILTVSTSPPAASPHVSVGQQVALEHVTDLIFWTNRWLALRTTGGEADWLLVGGVSGSELDPPGTTLDAFFGDPTVAEVNGLCEPFDDGCGPEERFALELTLLETYQVQAFDHGTAFIDILAFGYWFVVQSASRRPEPQSCDDIPPAWYQLVTVWFPSD